MNNASQSVPTLFLDFDGVLHPNHSPPGQLFSRAPLLIEAIGGSRLDIVVSSSWRFGQRLTGLRALLPEEIRSRVVGVTGQAHIGRHARWHEIARYCSDEGLSNWRALDDASFEFPDSCDQLILCDGGHGLRATQVAAIQFWLDMS